MSSGRSLTLGLAAALLTACGGGPAGDASSALAGGTTTAPIASGTITGGTGTATTPGGMTIPTGLNVLPITVNGSQCAAGSYLNKPCVTVTVCVPGTSTCQTIDDVLLDTGSFGLRIFKQVLTIPLQPASAGTGTGAVLAECVQYAGGMSDWGPVASADVVLGGEPAVRTPVQIIDSTFGVVPSTCTNVEASPATAGMTAILGVGPFAQDCASPCNTSPPPPIYFACSTSGCTNTRVSVTSQVQNPVALLPLDNNGILVMLPPVSTAGVDSLDGAVVLGIGTRTNNQPSGAVTTYPLDGNGEFEQTTLSGTVYSQAFVDTGSNGLFFSQPSAAPIAVCPSPNDSWFCPASTLDFQAMNVGYGGAPSGAMSFQIGDFLRNYYSGGSVFPDIGGPAPQASNFDWGLPFFLGRPVYLGIEGRSSPLGSGPYVAY